MLKKIKQYFNRHDKQAHFFLFLSLTLLLVCFVPYCWCLNLSHIFWLAIVIELVQWEAFGLNKEIFMDSLWDMAADIAGIFTGILIKIIINFVRIL